MTMMAEMSVIEPKAKECQKLPAKLPKPRRGKEKIPTGFRGRVPPTAP